MHTVQILLSLLALATLPSHVHSIQLERRTNSSLPAINAYAPQSNPCPSTPLVRKAVTLGPQESQYVAARRKNADTALAVLLTKLNAGFDTTSVPELALGCGAGGYRALLNCAGVTQALDFRDSNSTVNGLFQALTYQAGTSGGGWFLSSQAAQNWPTVSFLQSSIYRPNFPGGFLVPPGGFLDFVVAYKKIILDVAAKKAANNGQYPVTIADVYGRLLSYDLFPGNTTTDGSVQLTMSGLTTATNFTAANAPYPILMSRGVSSDPHNCTIPVNETQYEITPYEFGSWDMGVQAFVQTAYVGSQLSNGAPQDMCTKNFDNLGYFTAATSNVYPAGLCRPFLTGMSNFDMALDVLQAALVSPVDDDLANQMPNPFYELAGSLAVSGNSTLDIQDGGFGQDDPIWPFIQSQRGVNTLIISDACGDNATTYACDGSSLYNAYVSAQQVNLTKMPYIPSPDEFVARNISMTRAQFFGCNETGTVTLVWLPLANYSYPITYNALNIGASDSVVDGLIMNGNMVATQGNDAQWPVCLGCALMAKQNTSLPTACDACLQKYCVYPSS